MTSGWDEDSRAKAILLPSGSPEWNVYVKRTSHDFFHTAEYHRVYENFGKSQAWLSVYGTLEKFVAWPFLVQSIKGLGPPSLGKLRDVTSVYGYTGPLAHGCEYDQQFLRAAWNATRSAWHSLGVVSAFTRFHPLLGNHRYVPSLRDECQDADFDHDKYTRARVTTAIDVTRSPEETWQSYREQYRRAVRRTHALGMRVTSDPEWTYLDEFVNIYHSTLKRNRAAPFYFFSKAYLSRLREALGPHGSLMLVHYRDEIAAAGLLIEYGGIVHVHLSATASNALALSPSKLLIHEIQAWARSRHNLLVHLGGGRGSRPDDSLLHFKLGFSRKKYPFYTGRWVIGREKYNALTSARSQFLSTSAEGDGEESFFPIYRAPLDPTF